jgi:hypothetical protein
MRLAIIAASIVAIACAPAARVQPSAPTTLTAVSRSPEDSSTKQDLRLVPPEVYVRSYLQLFGGLAPTDVQQRARGTDGAQLFDTWDDYLAALGLPDYKQDLPRASRTNAIMVATFERLGVALCDRALEHDWKQKPPIPAGERTVFVFDEPTQTDAASFAARFDEMHRTFLSYPARLAPGRTEDFYALYNNIKKLHATNKKSRLSPEQAGWVSVCYGLVRHPEFHLY